MVSMSITFLTNAQMTTLNADTLGRTGSTDVIAFRLAHLTGLVGDVYICPAEARRSARAEGVPAQQELRRLVVHGVLHVLGYDHPDGASRTRSAMWEVQEQYVRQLGRIGTR
jgi:rRNA maturation RNase YbeY